MTIHMRYSWWSIMIYLPPSLLIESTQKHQGDKKGPSQVYMISAAKKYHALRDLTHDTCLPLFTQIYKYPTVHWLIHHLFISVLTPVLTMFCGFLCWFNHHFFWEKNDLSIVMLPWNSDSSGAAQWQIIARTQLATPKPWKIDGWPIRQIN